MANSNNNRDSRKGSDEENRTGNNPENRGNRKLPDNTGNAPDESISTAGDTSNGKYSRTNVRDEEVDNDDTRGGL